MSISISVDRLFQSFLDQGKIRREQLAIYLDEVAEDASLLAECWQQQLLDEVNHRHQSQEFLNKDGKLNIREKSYISNCNIGLISRLEFTYRDATIAFRGKLDKQFQDLFMGHLAELMLQRNKTKQAFDKIVSAANTLSLVSQNDNSVKIETLNDLVTALHKEAAALKVLARRYRTTN